MSGRYRTWMVSGVVLLLATACMPSREARSAGQVGCSPDEITISDGAFHPGLLQSGETWVAECRGRTFYCSQINSDQNDKQLLSSLASEQVSCQEEAESPQEAENREARREARARVAAKGPAAAPQGAAGFDFGVTAAEAQRLCEAAGHQWSHAEDHDSCSGPAAELGMTMRVDLTFCDDRACRITLAQALDKGPAAQAIRLKTQLESKYGTPHSTSGSVPEACRSEAQFARCLEQDTLHLSYKWQWSSGEGIELDVGKPAPSTAPAIRLRYSRPKGTANLSAL